jgi:hypothetical protein
MYDKAILFKFELGNGIAKARVWLFFTRCCIDLVIILIFLGIIYKVWKELRKSNKSVNEKLMCFKASFGLFSAVGRIV